MRLPLLIFLVFLMIQPTMGKLIVESKSVSLNEKRFEINVTLTNVSNGLSGYNITMVVDKATVKSIDFPSWASLKINSSVPSKTVWFKAVDLMEQVQGNAQNVKIVTLTMEIEKMGILKANLTSVRVDDDNGYAINVEVINGTVVIDKNGDGEIDITDVCYVACMVVDIIPDDLRADFNDNNRIDIGDLTKIAYFFVGK